MAPAPLRDGVRRAVRGPLALGLVVALGGCVSDRHPLATDGVCDVIADSAPIYAADTLDANGVPVGPRQAPFDKTIQLHMTQGNSPDRGAFVDLQINPPQALSLNIVDDTCEQLPGTFRCTAGKDGFATFLVRSEGDYAGDATIEVIGRQAANKPLKVTPAGLPEGTTNFQMQIEGITGNRVRAKYDKLACKLDASPDQPFDKWPVGKTRMRRAQIRATPPPTAPATIENAPVIVESLSAEVFVTKDSTCAPPRNNRLPLRLDKVGRSEEFFFCFSDVGGQQVQLTATSSGQQAQPQNVLQVDPEPRLLRVITVTPPSVPVDKITQVPALKLSAYDSDLNRVGFDVDVTTSDKSVLQLTNPGAKLLGKDQGDTDADFNVLAIGPGSAKLIVRPALYATPACESEPITVEAP